MKYVDASAVLRILFKEAGPTVPLAAGDVVVSSRVIEVEADRAVDRERLIGNLDDAETARKRHELGYLLGMIDLMSVDQVVIDQAKASFAVNVRALDAIHVASALRERVTMFVTNDADFSRVQNLPVSILAL